MNTYQLTPKVATVPTSKALQSLSGVFAELFHQSIFVQCENHSVDDEEIITMRDGFKIVTFSVKSVEMPTEAAYA